MFYETAKNDHGLPYNPFKAIVAPRPIGWISAMSAKGEINLAPYSFFNGLTDHPPTVMFASEGRKDSVVFAEETKEFVCNLATWELREPMNETSAPFARGVNEMEKTGLEAARMDLLLYDWLSELIFLKDRDREVFTSCRVRIEGEGPCRLSANVRGGGIDPERTTLGADPKAVTFHQFALERVTDGWRARVVIDI